MTRVQLLAALAALASLSGAAPAGPPVRIGIGIGFGAPIYRPYYAPYYAPYYRPYYYAPRPPIIIEPAPIVYQPAPVVVQQPQPVYVPAPAQTASSPQQAVYQASRPTSSVDGLLANLRSADENVRRDSAMDLGRMKATTAVQPLTATLAGDQSPVVRESAARALGLIGSSQALTALLHAAQSDPDRDVRHSAQFSVEVIRTNAR
jgi:hypothetical protein